MMLKCYNPISIPSCSIDPHYTRLNRVQTAVDGKIASNSEFQESCTEDNCKQFVYTDFSLNNILATGSTGMLNPVSMRNNDVSGIADKLDSIVNGGQDA